MVSQPFDLSLFDDQLTGLPFAHFQPIISIEDKHVVGYEALARGRTVEGKVVSIGRLFSQATSNLKLLSNLDVYIREEAIRRFAESGLAHKRKLFLNVMPRWLEVLNPEKNLEEVLPILKMVEKYNVPPTSIVLEITEGEFNMEPERMMEVIGFLRGRGFAIAIDDFGAGFSNVSRIGLVQPQFIKLDLNLIRRGFSDLIFKEILNAMAYLSEKIGSVLLVEGIESEKELYGALDIGARYLQGYFLAFPTAVFESLHFIDIALDEYLKDFNQRKLNQLKSLLYFNDVVGTFFETRLKEYFVPEPRDNMVIFKPVEPALFPRFWRAYLRLVYFVNAQGVQISPNYKLLRSENNSYYWEENREFIRKDWSWRPYFQSFIARREVLEETHTTSEPYRDIRSNESIVTFVYSYSDNVILCLDFSVAHLHDPLWHRAAVV